jgi:peptidoglycan/LPS O-acetylase OafA/YrhL
MIHVPIEVLFLTALKRVFGVPQGNNIPVDPWIGDAVTLLFAGVVLGLSVVTFRWIEEPLYRYGKALAARRLAAPDRQAAGIVGMALTSASRAADHARRIPAS